MKSWRATITAAGVSRDVEVEAASMFDAVLTLLGAGSLSGCHVVVVPA